MKSGTSLVVGRHEVTNPFALIGADEDSISLAIAWALRCSPRLLNEFSRIAVGREAPPDSVTIRIHRYESRGGITDIEIIAPGATHIIVEAKHGWKLPGAEQLTKYANRASFATSDARIKRIVTLSECSESYAAYHLEKSWVRGVLVRHVSWRSMFDACARARAAAGVRERHVLADLAEYLESVMTSQAQDSNLTYVLALNSSTPKRWTTSWKDIVNKYGRYFHPVGGNGWPREPPNYLAFRYSGRLQSIHHVEAYEVIEDLRKACPGIPRTPCEPHFLYRLGRAIVPSTPVKNGAIWPNGRYWCALDTLLTCETIKAARDVTQERLKKQETRV